MRPPPLPHHHPRSCIRHSLQHSTKCAKCRGQLPAGVALPAAPGGGQRGVL